MMAIRTATAMMINAGQKIRGAAMAKRPGGLAGTPPVDPSDRSLLGEALMVVTILGRRKGHTFSESDANYYPGQGSQTKASARNPFTAEAAPPSS
jgi:hypothetical protein